MRNFFAVLFILAPLMDSGLVAHGQIVQDTQIEVSSQAPNFTLTVFQDPTLGDPTSVFGDIAISGSSATLSITSINLDEGSDWFFAEHCDSFSEQTIANGDFDPLFDFTAAGVFTTFPRQVTVGEGFFLGVNTGVDPINFTANRDIFGWAELLVDSNGDLLVLDSAVNYGPGGIVIGKSQAVSVPEPNCSVVLLIGGVLLSRRRRESYAVQTQPL